MFSKSIWCQGSLSDLCLFHALVVGHPPAPPASQGLTFLDASPGTASDLFHQRLIVAKRTSVLREGYTWTQAQPSRQKPAVSRTGRGLGAPTAASRRSSPAVMRFITCDNELRVEEAGVFLQLVVVDVASVGVHL